MMVDSIGTRLKQAREEQELTLEEISLATHIKEAYLRAMEEDRFDDLPSPVQQKGFLRAYARQLGLAPGPLVNSLAGGPDDPPVEPREIIEDEKAPPRAAPVTRFEHDDHVPAAGEEPADRKFQGIGYTLREQREQLGLSLEDVEHQIHIPVRYLASIEGGRLEELPSTVQGRGMLKNYAEHIGLDPDQLLLRYADVLQKRLRETQPASDPKSAGFHLPLWMRRVFRGSSLVGVVVLLLVASALAWSALQVFGENGAAPAATETIPGVAEVLLPSQTPAATASLTLTPAATVSEEEEIAPPTPIETSAGSEDNQPTLEIADVQVQLIISQRSFVQVEVDGELEFSGRMLPGSVHIFGGQDRIEVTTANAAGVEVIFNQRDLGVLGVYGQVVNRIFTSEGIATATPTITPTPTVTDTPEVTATPTLTPTPPDP